MSAIDLSSRELGCDSFVHISAYPYKKTLCGQIVTERSEDCEVSAADCMMCQLIDAELEVLADEVMALA